ncbi:alpha,alpha-trehalase TreF [Robiginitalea sp.]|uniref:alpha,alpha-trehalase TreF n=1 Tax=Robiginitalea sp. TaxID=1902411 RepID=UPI003C70C713
MKVQSVYLSLFLTAALFIQCRRSVEITDSADTFYETELFKDVQLAHLFEDSKTFVDLERDEDFRTLANRYLTERERPGFDLRDFVQEHFRDPGQQQGAFTSDMNRDMYSHIGVMWDVLGRGPDGYNPKTSRIPLPHPYIVPGGRFKEIYYWDSYFTMIGLVSDNRMDIAEDMLANFAHLIDSLGFIPNGTRDYYLTRSQPPYFSQMVALLSQKEPALRDKYFPQIEKEYAYWMQGSDSLESDSVVQRVIRIGDDQFMNRYWDSARTPRPESYGEDVKLAENLPKTERNDLYAQLRAAAASGWDFSSRWYAREGEFASTNTADLLPVDLNSLIYSMEIQLAEGYRTRGDVAAAKAFEARAESRKERINKMMWDPQLKFYKDFNFASNSRCGEMTLAGVYPLYFGIASKSQAAGVVERLVADFLKPGGLVCTLRVTGQQWDAPNGWAPLQWMAVKGLLNYGYTEEAREIMQRWLALNERVYREEGKMMEKYNVSDTTLSSGGGEYPTQDGFGWTNGVALGFRDLLEQME